MDLMQGKPRSEDGHSASSAWKLTFLLPSPLWSVTNDGATPHFRYDAAPTNKQECGSCSICSADIADYSSALKSGFAIYISSSALAATSFFIALLTGFLSRALSTALLTDFSSTLLDVFLRTVWSIARSSLLVAAFLVTFVFAIYQSFVRTVFTAVQLDVMRLTKALMRYKTVNCAFSFCDFLTRSLLVCLWLSRIENTHIPLRSGRPRGFRNHVRPP
jgi:hypothetical protein